MQMKFEDCVAVVKTAKMRSVPIAEQSKFLNGETWTNMKAIKFDEGSCLETRLNLARVSRYEYHIEGQLVSQI